MYYITLPFDWGQWHAILISFWINYSIQQGCIKLIETDGKNIYATKDFNCKFIKESWKKENHITFSMNLQNICITHINLDNKKKKILSKKYIPS